MRKLLFLFIFTWICISKTHAGNTPTTLLYHKVLSEKEVFPELVSDDGLTFNYTSEGLLITGKEGTIRLDKYYSLGERMIRYHVKFSNDAIALFKSNTNDFILSVDVVLKKVSVGTSPVVWKTMDFLNSEHEYLVEIYRDYQKNVVRIVDIYTGTSDIIELITNGTGGHGAGIENSGFQAGNQHDFYCFGLQSGTFLLVKQISVVAGACDLFLLIYGDSITEPEGYFHSKDFFSSWTQLIMKNVPGKAISSGRGGCTIINVLERIQNELPFVKAKYVMITIGTNGGNTEENLSELVEFVMDQVSIPILNNIPSNESGTQINTNQTIEKIRQKYNIKGCKFDIVTSINHDGCEVDKSKMYFEDYTGSWGQIYHHPNVKGSLAMYLRTLIDIPEIYNAICTDW